MADRYWVGGSGTWDSVSTTNWSATSGGAGGASVPTYADNVIFNTLSNSTAYTVTFAAGFVGTGSISGTVLTITAVTSGTLTVGATIQPSTSTQKLPTDTTYILGGTRIVNQLTGTTGGVGTYTVNLSQDVATSQAISAYASCADITVSAPLTGTASFTSATSIKLSIYGSLLFNTGSITAFGILGEIFFCGTSTGKTITQNGIALGGAASSSVTFDGQGGGWTLGSAFSVGYTGVGFRLNNGSFSTGGLSLVAGGIQSLGTFTRSLNISSSTVTLNTTNGVNVTSTGLTFTSTGSTISLTVGSTVTFNGGGLTYNNVSFTNTGIYARTISGANTFNNLTFGNRTTAGLDVLTFSADQVVNGTLTLQNPTTYTFRRFLKSDITGTQRTITVANAAAFTAIDFQDIVIAGTAAPISGTSIGNAGNNSGITFSTPKTVYWSLTAGGSWATSGTGSWATTSGGTPASINFPLVQDTAIIQDTGLTTGNTITNSTSMLMGTVNFATRTLSMTWALTTVPLFYGALFLSSAVTITGQTVRTGTAADSTVYAAGVAIGNHPPIIIDSPTVDIGTSANAVSVYTGSSAYVPSAISYTLGTAPSVFTGVSLFSGSGSISFSATSPNIATVAYLNISTANIGVSSQTPNVYVGYSAKPSSANTSVLTLAPAINAGKKLTIPTSITYTFGVAPNGVGVTSGRRVISISVSADNSTQMNTTINGVVINDVYNQAI